MSKIKVVANLIPKTVGKAAEFYASTFGWRIFPLYEIASGGGCTCSKGTECISPGKHPRITIPKGADGIAHPATNDVAQIRKWWGKWTSANIGVWLEGSGVAAVDIDKNEKKDGFKGMEEVKAHAGQTELPKTLVCNTPSGGVHLYFEFREGVPNKANALGPGIDIWSEKHYLILPPSNHWKGGTYQWDTTKGDAPLPFPDWMLPVNQPEATAKAEEKKGPGRPAGSVRKERLDIHDEFEVSRLVHALNFVDNTDRDTWVLVGFAIARAFDWEEEGFKIYDKWSSAAHNYDPKKTNEQYYVQSKVTATKPITTASIFEWASKNTAYVPLKKVDDRHLVRYHPANTVETLGDLAQYLGEFPIYQRSSQLVEIVPINKRFHDDQADAWHPEGSYLLRSISPLQLQVRILPTLIRWEKFTETHGWSATKIDPTMCEALLTIGNWPTANNLRAFVQHPTIREDGSIVSAVGYDQQSGLFVTDHVDIKIPKRPSKKDAILAAKYLLHPFSEYKFLDGSTSKAVLLAAILTVGVRHLFNAGVPFFTIEAPIPGAGKSKLATAISLLWFGTTPSTTPYSEDREEMRKHLASLLLSGARVILFDNIHPAAKVNDPVLNALITSGKSSFRLLGSNDMVDLESTATFFATGNRMKVVGDMMRRTLRIHIDPEGVHPHERKFKIDPLEGYITKNRAKLVSAALTLLSAFFKAGKPKATKKEPPLASFEQWSAIIREAIVWVGHDDVKNSIADSHDDDEESEDLQHLLRELYKIPALQINGMQSAALFPIIVNDKKLQDALFPFVSSQNSGGINNPKVVTYALKRVLDVPVDGKKLIRQGSMFFVREA